MLLVMRGRMVERSLFWLFEDWSCLIDFVVYWRDLVEHGQESLR